MMTMDNDIDIRTLKCIEGILFSYKMIKSLYQKLWNSCLSINCNTNNVYESFEICWSLIDAIHRIREISQQIPKISKKEGYIKDLINNTAIVEEFRDYIQHLRNEINKAEVDNFPVWGSLSWVDKDDEKTSYTIIIGAYIENTSFSGCVYDTYQNKWLSKVSLSIKDKSLNYDIVYECVERFIKSFANNLDDKGIKLSDSLLNPSIVSMKLEMN